MASVLIRAHVATESKLISLFDWAGVIGRIGLALLFLWSGYEKLANPAFTVTYMQSYGLPAADVLMWPALLLELVGGALCVMDMHAYGRPVAYVLMWPALLLELVGGAMLVLGWKARWVALALAGY